MKSRHSIIILLTILFLLFFSLTASAQSTPSQEAISDSPYESSEAIENQDTVNNNPKTADGSLMFLVSIPVLCIVILGSCKTLYS